MIFHKNNANTKKPYLNLVPPVEKDIICPQINYDNQTTGKFETPGFPGKYPNSADCRYLITVPMGKRVSVIFNVFDTEECCDFVTIYEGINKDETNVLQRVSGKQTGLIVTTNATNIMEIHFHSDGNFNYQGFFAVFDAVEEYDPGFIENQCSSNFTDPNGVVVSPGFPFNYPPNANCGYLIGNGNPGTTVTLIIETFATEACCDHLRLYDGTDNNGTLIMDMSGTQVPETTYNSTQSYMFLEFKSDGNGQDSGYSIKYEIIDPTQTSVTTGPSFHNIYKKPLIV
uniref:CUB domain-containing protein n=1 Tax=Panagrolaimus superbus TaxID=310955 RepID=A0A914XYV2_9BILA